MCPKKSLLLLGGEWLARSQEQNWSGSMWTLTRKKNAINLYQCSETGYRKMSLGSQLTHWKRPWCWERLKAKGEEGGRGWDGWMASPTQWTWTWANFRRQWGTGRPGVLQSMGSQRVGYNCTTKQQQQLWAQNTWRRTQDLKRTLKHGGRQWAGVLCNTEQRMFYFLLSQSRNTISHVYT